MAEYVITLKGIVQNVGFRYKVKKQSEELGFFGFVKNIPNGDVIIRFSGTERQFLALYEYLQSCPGRSRVDGIYREKAADRVKFDSFKILY